MVALYRDQLYYVKTRVHRWCKVSPLLRSVFFGQECGLRNWATMLIFQMLTLMGSENNYFRLVDGIFLNSLYMNKVSLVLPKMTSVTPPVVRMIGVYPF